MPVGSPFLSHLQHLTARLDDNDSRDSGDSLDDALSSLVTDLGATVASYCGLRLTVMNSGQPVILTDFPEPGSPTATSLSVPLPLLVPQMGIGSRIVFCAASAGA